MIEFHLDPSSGVATYVQLVQQVHKAYRDLERSGLVRARPGLGTFVVGRLPRTDPAAQARFRRSMSDWLRKARGAGLTQDEIEAIYRTALRDCFSEEGVA
jgi:GntR family transcriptional regulator